MENLLKVFSWDLDEVFAYSTNKLVWIRDRHVGYLYYSLVVSVCLFIIGYQIIWSNQHFLRKDVDGLARMWFSHPTRGNCDPVLASCKSNFRSLTSLPYCDVYQGPQNYRQRAPCRFENKVSMIPDGSVDNRLFIPTAIEVMTERLACFPGPSNNYKCDNEYQLLPGSDCLTADGYMCKTRGNKTDQFYYVADVHDIRLRFTSSYERDSVRGTSLMHPAWVGICRSKLTRKRRERSWSERTQEYGTKWCALGDYELRRLPCLPGVNCTEMRSTDLPNTSNSVDWSHHTGSGERLGSHTAFVLVDGATGGQTPATATARQQPGAPKREAHRRTPAYQGNNEGRTSGTLKLGAAGDVFIQRSSARRSRSVVITEDPPVQPPAVPTAAAGMARSVAQAIRRAVNRIREESVIQPTTEKGVLFSDEWGDVFSLGELLELAGVDLDNDYNMHWWTTRQAGTALEVRVVYNNLYPVWSSFGYQPVMYHYEVKELMLPYFSKQKLSPVQPADYPTTRRYEVQHGVVIRFVVGGELGFFNLVFFGLMVCTALATTAFAGTLTDCVGLYLHPKRDNFFHLKYEVSPDFSDMWKCPTCGFYNELEYVQCRGVPAWMGPGETPECRTLRPQVIAGFRRSRSRAMVRVAQMKVRTEARRALLGQDSHETFADAGDTLLHSSSQGLVNDLVEQSSSTREPDDLPKRETPREPEDLPEKEASDLPLASRARRPRKPTLLPPARDRRQDRHISFESGDENDPRRQDRHISFQNADEDDAALDQPTEARGSTQSPTRAKD